MTYLREREAFFKPPSAEVRAPGDVKPAVRVGFKRLTPDAVLPTKAHVSDSGFDLVAAEDVIIAPGETVIVPTGIAVELPAGYEATVRPRSGITAKTKLRVQLGTIDNSYRGEIGVIVDNTYTFPPDTFEFFGNSYAVDGSVIDDLFCENKHKTYLIRKNDRIAQLVITRLPDVEAVEVFDVGASERGANGFGSSGVTTKEDE